MFETKTKREREKERLAEKKNKEEKSYRQNLGRWERLRMLQFKTESAHASKSTDINQVNAQNSCTQQ